MIAYGILVDGQRYDAVIGTTRQTINQDAQELENKLLKYYYSSNRCAQIYITEMQNGHPKDPHDYIITSFMSALNFGNIIVNQIGDKNEHLFLSHIHNIDYIKTRLSYYIENDMSSCIVEALKILHPYNISSVFDEGGTLITSTPDGDKKIVLSYSCDNELSAVQIPTRDGTLYISLSSDLTGPSVVKKMRIWVDKKFVSFFGATLRSSEKVQKTFGDLSRNKNLITYLPTKRERVGQAPLTVLFEDYAEYLDHYSFEQLEDGYGTRMFTLMEADYINDQMFPTGAVKNEVAVYISDNTVGLLKDRNTYFKIELDKTKSYKDNFVTVPRMLLVDRQQVNKLISRGILQVEQ